MNMEKLEINEENYELYQKLLQIRNSRIDSKYAELVYIGQILGTMLMMITVVLGMIPVTHLALTFGDKLGTLFSIEERIIHTGVIACYGMTVACTLFSLPKIICHIRTNIFHKKHPNVDIKVKTEEIKKELNKYNQLSKTTQDIEKKEEEHLSKVSTDIEEKREEHLSNYSDKFQESTAEEMLAFLKEEKVFWEQVAIEEKYRDTDEDTTGQTEIGQVKSPTENGGKVYHR